MTMPEQPVVPHVVEPTPTVETRTDDLALEYADEEVMFRKDGTIVWRAAGVRTLLRRPKFKELRALNEEINALADENRTAREPLTARLRAIIDPIQDQIAALGEAPDPVALVGLQAALRVAQSSPEYLDVSAELRKQRDEADSALMEWFRDSILYRFGKPRPSIEDAEDLPGWCIDPTFTRELLTHWSSVPRRPGVV